MSAKKSVQFFYDVVSPYSWLGFEVLTRYRSKWNISLQLKPFFLGGVMQGAGNKPPGLVPNKAAYAHQDLLLLADCYGVPLHHPKDFVNAVFEKGSLQAQRLLTALQMIDPNYVEPFSRELWMRIWSRDEDITTTESFREAGKRLGISNNVMEDALTKMKSQEVKDQLKAVTQEALDKKAFGAPFYVAHVAGKEYVFFGCDRIEILAHTLGEKYEGPLRELSQSKLSGQSRL